ncbi:MAG: type II secretion system protein [Fimbriimonas sp.]
MGIALIRRANFGFTLIEVLSVMAIVCLLAAVLFPSDFFG